MFWMFALKIDDLSDFWNGVVAYWSAGTLNWVYIMAYSAWGAVVIHEIHEQITWWDGALGICNGGGRSLFMKFTNKSRLV